LLRAAPEHDLVLELNVGQRELVDLATVAPDDERVRSGRDAADKVSAGDLRFLPLVHVVDLVRVWDLLNMESVLFTRFLLLLLLQCRQL
jgi:hypothetical protein